MRIGLGERRLAKTAMVLLNNYHDGSIDLHDRQVKFDMTMFAANEHDLELVDPVDMHECGTSCCFLGLGAYLYHDMIKGHEVTNWSLVGAWLFSIYYNEPAWDFLFSGSLPSDPIEIANRVVYYIETNETRWPCLGKRFNKEELIKKLDAILLS